MSGTEETNSMIPDSMVLPMTKAALLSIAYIYQFSEIVVPSSFFCYFDLKTFTNMRSTIS
jgi:hypothetical protein